MKRGLGTDSNQACEAGTAPTASDRSTEGAADARSADGLWIVGVGSRE